MQFWWMSWVLKTGWLRQELQAACHDLAEGSLAGALRAQTSDQASVMQGRAAGG